VSARWKLRLLVGGLCLLALGVTSYFVAIRYLAWRESESPSAGRVLVLEDGRRIPLLQPGYVEPPPQPDGGNAPSPAVPRRSADIGEKKLTPEPAHAQRTPPSRGGEAGALPDVAQPQVMPPIRLVIGETGSDWPVVLSNGVQLPRFKAVGWLLGSAYPGSTGNMVLFGHVDGKYATLERLKELIPGDTFLVHTSDAQYVYRVLSIFETDPYDVGVMAPTGTATATLITCSGRWDAAEGMYDRRLVVTADYLPDHMSD
jgi:LPXTG-site transpeptidase (sortase) family protein